MRVLGGGEAGVVGEDADGLGQGGDEGDGFLCVVADLHLRVADSVANVWSASASCFMVMAQLGEDLLVVRLVQEAEMGDLDADLGVVLYILHQEVGISLSPIARAARVSSTSIQIPAQSLAAVS